MHHEVFTSKKKKDGFVRIVVSVMYYRVVLVFPEFSRRPLEAINLSGKVDF